MPKEKNNGKRAKEKEKVGSKAKAPKLAVQGRAAKSDKAPKKKPRASVGTNIHTSPHIDEPHDKFQWLSNYEFAVLARGGYYDDEGILHNEEGSIRCTSIIKATGKRCKNFAIPGELDCHIHGGTLARAKAGKQRIYSAFISDPTLATIYENSVNDENKEVAGLREELGLLRTLLAGAISVSEKFEPKELKDIAGVIGEIRQLVDGCTKAEIRLGQLVDIGKVVIMMQQAANIIAKYVTDKEVLRAIAIDFDNITVPSAIATTPQLEPVGQVRKVPELPGEIS
jgi:hypothetical protein